MKKLGTNIALLCIAGLLTLSGCSGRKNSSVVSQNSPIQKVDDRPSWVKSRPVSTLYYTGISVSSRKHNPVDFIEATKQKALQDLASEIKVNISSNSVFYKIDQDDAFREEYTANINTSVSHELESFELVDTYDDGEHYWVYYRLNKRDYQEQQQAKKRMANQLALDHFSRAKAYEQSEKYVLALKSYFESLKALENYLGEVNEVTFQGEQIFLGNETYYSLQKLWSELQLTAEPTQLSFTRGVSPAKTLQIKATHHSKKYAIAEIPLKAEFTVGDGLVDSELKTNFLGNAIGRLKKVYSRDVHQEITVTPDIDKLFEGSDQLLSHLLLGAISVKSVNIAVDVEGPAIYLQTNERNLGKHLSEPYLYDQVVSMLVNEGYSIAKSPRGAEFSLRVEADTRAGAETSSIYSAFLEVKLELFRGTDLIFQEVAKNVKGVQLSYARAGLDAYKKVSHQLRDEIIVDMLERIEE